MNPYEFLSMLHRRLEFLRERKKKPTAVSGTKNIWYATARGEGRVGSGRGVFNMDRALGKMAPCLWQASFSLLEAVKEIFSQGTRSCRDSSRRADAMKCKHLRAFPNQQRLSPHGMQ
jgi:hypothetical protein